MKRHQSLKEREVVYMCSGKKSWKREKYEKRKGPEM
jgi:hypothetical protein